MSSYEAHSVSYSGTTESDWSAPSESDFETDDLSTIDDHYLLSSSGFPPEDFGDLQIPVVDPDGNLNLNALQTAYSGGHSVEAVDGIDSDTVGQVKGIIQRLASEEFDHEIGD
ncbi:hypothetical protein [Haloarcula nitratireducens]|uniref:Uncharacterized protein n=1 Tax=Haloarcula nitratireducens TaxID=2487749 RepID=A0AAW4PAT2_9EURY|nr:hypothetical protein [Halomicroarcula nitratireducens]MBX0294387.1 hypothetical protein [Halomicroarcula nitratireducens]